MWVNRFLTKKKLSYIGFGGSKKRVYSNDDVSDIIYKQIVNFNKIKNETFNIGGGVKNSISLKELTRICEDITKSKIKFRKIKTTSIYDIPYYVSDNSKIKKFYNWAPKRNIYKIIRDIYIWMSENKNLIKKYSFGGGVVNDTVIHIIYDLNRKKH